MHENVSGAQQRLAHAQQPTRLHADFDPVRAFYPNFIEAAVAKHFPALFVCFVTNINVNWVATARKLPGVTMVM